MSRYPTRFKSVVFILATLVLIMTLAVNVILIPKKEQAVRELEKYFTAGVSIGGIFFVFPNVFIFKDVALHDPSGEKFSLIVPVLAAQLSIRQFVFERSMSVSTLAVVRPEVNSNFFYGFLSDNSDTLKSLLESFPVSDVRVSIRQARLVVPRQSGKDIFRVDFGMNLRKKKIKIFGEVKREEYRRYLITGEKPFVYNLHGTLDGGAMFIDKLTLEKGGFFAQLWGDWLGRLLAVQGFVLVDRPSKTGGFNFDDEDGRVWLRWLKPKIEDEFNPKDEVAREGLALIDIQSRVNVNIDAVDVQQFDFLLNNIPIQSKGRILLRDPLSWDGELVFLLSRSGIPGSEQVPRLGLKFSGAWNDNAVESNATVTMYGASKESEKKEQGPFVKTVEAEFKNMLFRVDRFARIRTDTGQADIIYWTGDRPHLLSLPDLRAVFYVLPERYEMFELESPFYGGIFKGKIWTDATQKPFQMTAVLDVEGADAGQLSAVTGDFARLQGQFNSRIRFANYPLSALTGSVDLRNGTIRDFELFGWIAGMFQMPSLKNAAFDEIIGEFLIKNSEVTFQDIRLTSHDLALEGFFKVDQEDLVSSKLSLSFSRELLKESPKLRALLKLFSKDVDSLTFDFQLSGKKNAMNFQWLQSDFKKRIQQKMPDFIERKIERSIDTIMGPGEENQ